MAKKAYPEKYCYSDWSDTYHDDELYHFWHVATPRERKKLMRAAWKEEKAAKAA
jgi:hypothetical protein